MFSFVFVVLPMFIPRERLANYLLLEYKVKTKCNLPTSLKRKTTFDEQMELVFHDETPHHVFLRWRIVYMICKYQIVLLLMSVCECLFEFLFIVFRLNLAYWIIVFVFLFSLIINCENCSTSNGLLSLLNHELLSNCKVARRSSDHTGKNNFQLISNLASLQLSSQTHSSHHNVKISVTFFYKINKKNYTERFLT